jgi:hypothetical protein
VRLEDGELELLQVKRADASASEPAFA